MYPTIQNLQVKFGSVERKTSLGPGAWIFIYIYSDSSLGSKLFNCSIRQLELLPTRSIDLYTIKHRIKTFGIQIYIFNSLLGMFNCSKNFKESF